MVIMNFYVEIKYCFAMVKIKLVKEFVISSHTILAPDDITVGIIFDIVILIVTKVLLS